MRIGEPLEMYPNKFISNMFGYIFLSMFFIPYVCLNVESLMLSGITFCSNKNGEIELSRVDAYSDVAELFTKAQNNHT